MRKTWFLSMQSIHHKTKENIICCLIIKTDKSLTMSLTLLGKAKLSIMQSAFAESFYVLQKCSYLYAFNKTLLFSQHEMKSNL